MSELRLDRFISNQTVLSRSAAVSAIRKGRVFVNGKAVKSASYAVNAECDSVLLDGQAVEYKKYVYLILNKPAGVLSASRDKGRKTVLDLVPAQLKRPALSPVGRLDKDTTGLLIITDDGDFAHKCISPKYMIPKTYIARLDRDITNDDIAAFENGIVLHDGTRCMPAALERVEKNTAKVTVYEGKYHQIKRMFGVLDAGVNALCRVSVGLLKLPENLEEGSVKEVDFDCLLKNVINYKQIEK